MDKSQSSINIDIPQPFTTNNFQVIFSNPTLDVLDERKKLTLMVTTIVLDLSSNQMVIAIDHSPIPKFLELIKNISTNDTIIQLILTSSQTGQKIDSQLYPRARCTKHEFMLDTMSQAIAKHVLVFNIS